MNLKLSTPGSLGAGAKPQGKEEEAPPPLEARGFLQHAMQQQQASSAERQEQQAKQQDQAFQQQDRQLKLYERQMELQRKAREPVPQPAPQPSSIHERMAPALGLISARLKQTPKVDSAHAMLRAKYAGSEDLAVSMALQRSGLQRRPGGGVMLAPGMTPRPTSGPTSSMPAFPRPVPMAPVHPTPPSPTAPPQTPHTSGIWEQAGRSMRDLLIPQQEAPLRGPVLKPSKISRVYQDMTGGPPPAFRTQRPSMFSQLVEFGKGMWNQSQGATAPTT